MTMLRQWFEREYARLETEGKAALVNNFGAFTQAYFAADYNAVFWTLPDLYRLATHLGEPVWRVVLNYYDAPAHIYWRGDLSCGLKLATEAIVQALTLLGPGDTLTHYIREVLLYAWLRTDAPGYVDDVQVALDEVLEMPLDRDLEVRFGLVRACCLEENGRADEAWTLVQGLLPDLDWPEPYHHNLRASLLTWLARYDEAVPIFAKAASGFMRLGHTIEANSARIGQGDALAQCGRIGEALDVLYEALASAQHSLNRAQIGSARGLIAQTLLDEGRPDEALPWFERALEALEGLGWLRQEAAYALARVRILGEVETGHEDARYAAILDARRCVARLRSTDLRDELAVLLDDAGDRI